MKREQVTPRNDWQQAHERLGFPTTGEGWAGYWGEDTAYRFTPAQINDLKDATQRLHDTCMEALEAIIGGGDYYERFDLPEEFIPYIEKTWKRQDPSFYGRFDLAYDGKQPPKMIEYNADTAGTLFESSVLQRDWLKAQDPSWRQFNDVHEQMVRGWKQINGAYTIPKLYFARETESIEDMITTNYMAETAEEAGIPTATIGLSDIGWNKESRSFTDLDNYLIQCLYMFYPWEFMVRDEFAQHILEDQTGFMEPAYSMLLSNKAILSVLWERAAGHPNLLPASMDAARMTGDYVRKPLWGQEGGGVTLVRNGVDEHSTAEGYRGDGWDRQVYQQYFKLPEFSGRSPVIGSWVVDGKACGIGIREDEKITTGTARFVPHFIAPG